MLPDVTDTGLADTKRCSLSLSLSALTRRNGVQLPSFMEARIPTLFTRELRDWSKMFRLAEPAPDSVNLFTLIS